MTIEHFNELLLAFVYLPIEITSVIPSPRMTLASSACSRRPRKTLSPKTSVGIHGMSATLDFVERRLSTSKALSTEIVEFVREFESDELEEIIENVDVRECRRESINFSLAECFEVDGFFVDDIR